jgi:hypothetical protein
MNQVAAAVHSVTVDVGRVPIRLNCANRAYAEVLARRFEGFVGGTREPVFEFNIEIAVPSSCDADAEVSVRRNHTEWIIERPDCTAVLDVRSGRGHIRQPPQAYATDTVLRILHSLLLAPRGGLLLHASSAIRAGRAFVFFGPSGSGKSTLIGMAPHDATVLSEEISYVRRQDGRYLGCGTPFTGELNQRGANCDAPLAGLFHLVHGDAHRVEALPEAEAVRLLMQSVLCFPGDSIVTKQVFAAACDLAARVPVLRLTFTPDARVWELIGGARCTSPVTR